MGIKAQLLTVSILTTSGYIRSFSGVNKPSEHLTNKNSIP